LEGPPARGLRHLAILAPPTGPLAPGPLSDLLHSRLPFHSRRSIMHARSSLGSFRRFRPRYPPFFSGINHACTPVSGFVSSISRGSGSVCPLGFIHSRISLGSFRPFRTSLGCVFRSEIIHSLICLASFHRFRILTRGRVCLDDRPFLHISIPGRSGYGTSNAGWWAPRRAGSLPRV